MENLIHAEPKHVNMSAELAAVPGSVPVDPASAGAEKAAGGVACLVPSYSAAVELLSAPYSCLVMNTRRRHVVLPPVYLYKKRTGIQEELEAELLKFSQSLNGVPLAYDDIRIVGRYGDIFDDSGYIHMDIEANFVVFQPKKGQKLLGKVNKLGVSHVGCLVHGCFNASIPKPNLVSVETWRDAGPKIGTELEFEVTALDADAAGVLLIRGRLLKTRVQELLAMCESSESTYPGDTEPNPESVQQEPEDTPKKKKKKKKDQIKEEEAEEEVTRLTPSQADGRSTPHPNGTTDEMQNDEAGEKKKKKKKKKEKHLKDETEEVEVSRAEVHCSDSSGYLSDKPSKKRKHENGNDGTPSLSDEITPTKSKKKKKTDVEQYG
ncbi:DNA-directed RNA polymerase I subunit RPA43 [Oryzias melastigma]|uniref:DNA-directed RNA polymerase subunit n=1 Tax=Oryzias melastigma TaxID=30732 RepID=A0A3B3DLX0_ORYME|nr:DNA-directed RNA polymerase I subunit RPA43 [Oryzias melastigma]